MRIFVKKSSKKPTPVMGTGSGRSGSLPGLLTRPHWHVWYGKVPGRCPACVYQWEKR